MPTVGRHDAQVGSTTLLGTRSVSTPTGEEWRVGRRWITRARPRWRRVPGGKATGEALSLPDFGDPQDVAASLAIVLGVVVVAVIVIPLLLFGIELIALGFVIAGSIVGRGLLGRPWIVEARPVRASVPTYTWRARGWRHSAQLADEVAAALSAGLDPPLPRAAEATLP
ncbi:MAG TPA: hypothetical protein VLJ80_08920 [Solirubrobacteraceae bacterium]|nr:hypothetical protein [Solirubrobacteraceae bacterium]